ncbi:MAG: glycosyltransferase family 4 protein [Candidatus Omnitrophica bacterium]|nr:glycosyltransferase family 4 protein [Candidatus Omnitrophota bacterium]
MKRIVFKSVVLIITFIFSIGYLFKRIFKRNRKVKIGLLDIEFFHKEAGGFGGYGKTAKNITDYFSSNGKLINIEILLTRNSKKPTIKTIHNTNVIVAPDAESSNLINIFKYAYLLNNRRFDFLMTVEYCTDYQYTCFLQPKVPLIIWIHDPRPKECLEKIATVSWEVLAEGKKSPEELKIHEQNVRRSINKVISLSKLFNRKIIFATTAYFLIERAKKLYNLSDISPIVLPIPVDIPKLDGLSYSPKPSVCFLARLDPPKRPWIFFELARRFKDVDFLVAGKTHFPKIMEPILKEYNSLPNLRFLGFLDDEQKDKMLREVWALINTSIHEGLPVSFLECFAYGKPIISCQNPDNLVEKFGIYTGEILGDGNDIHAIDIFANALERFLSNDKERIEKGIAAREFVTENYSFRKFEEVIKKLIFGK